MSGHSLKRIIAVLATGPAWAAQTSVAQSVASSVETADGTKIQEIIVTAQKQGQERLQDVPVPITVLDATQLAESNQNRLEDYFANIPGLSFQKSSYGALLSIRGLTAGNYGNPTVGIVLDDVPYGGTINPGYAPYAPDLDPGDLARIEVLRGPQGTLYGASSLGGLIKYVTVDPSPDRFSGRVQLGSNHINGGNDLGYTVRGSANVPLSDDLAIRVSGFTRQDPGYVDNVRTGQKDVNEVRAEGGRLSALWAPSELFTVKLSALVQELRPRGSDVVDVSLGNDFQQDLVRGTGASERKTQAYTATITSKLGSVELTSISGYSEDKTSIVSDGVDFYDFMAGSLFGVDGSTEGATLDVTKFTQEIRASLPIGSSIQWSLGAFYTNEKFGSDWNVFANDSVSGARAGSMLTVIGPATYEEYAAFTNLTFDITDRFDVQLGGRFSKIDETFSSLRYGPLSTLFYGDDPSVVPEARAEDSPFNYLLTPRYRISPDLMVYARLASGYRPGGGNINCNASAGIPCEFEADTSRNYEVGIKGNLLDQTVSFDASAYYIDWKDIQITLFNPDFGVTYQDNAGLASSQGVELSVQARPMRGLTLSAWVNYNDAELTQALPSTSLGMAGDGDRLPYSSRMSGNLSVDKELPLWADATGYIGTALVYVGDRKGAFQSGATPRGTLPSYVQWNLRAGVRFDSWTLDAFVNNVTDKRSVISDATELGPNLFNYTRPREIGLSLSKSW
jgi:outer membrane receptor protein involved in Fe transport